MSMWGIRLNRTSVGLKREISIPEFRICFVPQSNQRGIETQICPYGSSRPPTPQSNQRGIETQVIVHRPTLLELASIEPAWD